MASNKISGFMFDTEDLYGDKVKAHIRIHELDQALTRGLETFSEFKNLFLKIEKCNDIDVIKTLKEEFCTNHTALQ